MASFRVAPEQRMQVLAARLLRGEDAEAARELATLVLAYFAEPEPSADDDLGF